MKEAFWGLGLLVLSILGIILINLFGNITVTNQLNYTTMKNAVDASMNDAISYAYYSSGFCVCTNLEMKNDKWDFSDKSQYELVDVTHENGVDKCVSNLKNCKILYGENRIDTKTFVESITRRFVEMINNNKEYRIIVQEVIEYPPKVSVRIVSKDDEFSPTEKNSGGYSIVNQIDSIIETNGIVKLKNSNESDKKKIYCDEKCDSFSDFKNGWNEKNGNWYYFEANEESGKALCKKSTGWKKAKWDNGNKEDWFYFNSDGVMLTGWQQLAWSKGTNWFYFDQNGAMVTGWQKLSWSGGTDWFYFDKESGAMTENQCLTIDKTKYCFDDNGACLSGNNGKIACSTCSPTNGYKIGWNERNKRMYYYDKSTCALLKGWHKLTRNGRSGYFYFDSGGALVTSKSMKFNGNSVHFDFEGICSPDELCTKAAKAASSSSQSNSSNNSSNTNKSNGWQMITYNNKTGWYYLKNGTIVKSNCVLIDNKITCFDKNGICLFGSCRG